MNNKYLDEIQKFRLKCGQIVNNPYVQLIMVGFITINAIMMGIATYDYIKLNPTLSNIFDITDQVFLIIFTIELVLQFIYHGYHLLYDGWLVFDLIIIGMSWAFQSVQIIRAFRIFRAFRLITRVKIMRNLILALVEVMPRMAAIFLMLLLIFYIFGVMFTQLFSEVDTGESDYFGSLSATLLTLFQFMTLDGWSGITREIMVTNKWAWLPSIVFVFISGFVVVNLIIAVICDAIGTLDEQERAHLEGVSARYGDDDDDDDNDDSKFSDHSGDGEPLELREQLDTLEDQMGNLTRIQARTFHTLQYLTQQLQMQKEAKEKKQELDDDKDYDNNEWQNHKNDNNKKKEDDTLSSRPQQYQLRRRSVSLSSLKTLKSWNEEEKNNSTNNKDSSTPRKSLSSKTKRRSGGSTRNVPLSTRKRRSGGSSKSNNSSSSSSSNNRVSPVKANSRGSTRVSYTDTWTQQGSSKELRQASISNFAKAAKELKKLREQKEEEDVVHSD